MAEHMRNQLAREGFVLRKHSVSTLTRFVDQLELADSTPSPAQLEAMIVSVLLERCPADYQAVADQSGFHRHLAASVEALSLAGVSPHQLEGPLADIYGRILKSLDKQELALRGQRLEQTTRLLEASHLRSIGTILLDGFFSFSNTETAFLDKLASLIQVERTEAVHASADTASNRKPAIELRAADDQAHEALLIASEILRMASEGVELRRIGILLRNPAVYGPLLESTLARLDIPSRSYLGTPLAQHPVFAFHRALILAMQSGWHNVEVLSAMRWRLTGLGGALAGDALEQQVRFALPSNSLELFVQLAPFADWPGQYFSPTEACTALKQFATLIEAPRQIEPSAQNAWVWHQRASALKMLHDAMEATADQCDVETRVTLDAFWRLVETNLAETSLHERDTRRNVVHVMDLFESRQWDLDYVFAPGISEGEFPKQYSPDPLLTENLKRSFGMKTLEERNAEEHFLYEMLLTRASRGLTITYPRVNAKGDPVLPSSVLAMQAKPADAVTVATRAVAWSEPPSRLGLNYRQPRPWSASEFETYLACPWKHFASRCLKLEGLPELPAERLNPILLGNVAHQTITDWTRGPARDIESIAERNLERACRLKRVPLGYHYERERINLLRNLRLYAKHAPPIPEGWRTHLAERFEHSLENGLEVRGEFDRYDESPTGEIHAYDFKYSKATGLEEKYPIQGALYALALGGQVTRFSFIALREQARPAVLEAATLQSSIELARKMIDEIVEGVATGAIPVQPRNRDNCQYCLYQDACRIRNRAVEEESAGFGGATEA